MKIFTKKAFVFKIGDKAYKCPVLGFVDVPPAVTKTVFFKLAQKDGDVEIVTDIAARKRIESGQSTPPNKQQTVNEANTNANAETDAEGNAGNVGDVQ